MVKTILCYSGGLDSSLAKEYLNPDLVIYFDLRSRYSEKEKSFLMKDIAINQRLNLKNLEIGEKAYIPFRNLFLAMMAYLEGLKKFPSAKKLKIAIVGVKGDKVEDKTPEAYKKMADLLNFINKKELPKIEVFSPFWKWTKGELVRKFKNKVDFRKIVSCYQSTSKRCGRCPACFRFWVALESNDITCWDWFEKDIRRWKGIQVYKEKLNTYDKNRQKEIRYVLEKYNL